MISWTPSIAEQQAMLETIVAARQVQEFLWGETRADTTMPSWQSVIEKRIVKIREIRPEHPHAAVELRKRLLQLAGVSIALIGIIDQHGVPWGTT